jgi:hypothetical protein
MEPKEFAEVMRWLIAEKIDGLTSPTPVVFGGTPLDFPAWSFRTGQVLAVAAIDLDRNDLRLTFGLATNIPYVPEVSHYLNEWNRKELVFGRTYLVGNDQSGLGSALAQEIIPGESVSWEFPASIQNLQRVIGTISGQLARLAPELCSQYGAKPFNDDQAFNILAES